MYDSQAAAGLQTNIAKMNALPYIQDSQSRCGHMATYKLQQIHSSNIALHRFYNVLCSGVLMHTNTHTDTQMDYTQFYRYTKSRTRPHIISFRCYMVCIQRSPVAKWMNKNSLVPYSIIDIRPNIFRIGAFQFLGEKKENKHSQTRTHTHRERKTFIFIRSMRNRKAIYRPSSINAYIYMTECFVRWMAKMRSSEFVFDFLKQKVAKSSLGHLESFHAFPSKCFSLKNLNA